MEDKTQNSLLKVGELARQCDKTVRALHLYEDLGLLEPHSRSPGGFRLYSTHAVNRIEWIGKLQDLGLSLTDIQQLLRDWSGIRTANRAMARLRELLDQRRAEIHTQIAHLHALEEEMDESLNYLERCRGCDAEDPARCSACSLTRAPMLINQFHAKGTGEHPTVVIPVTVKKNRG